MLPIEGSCPFGDETSRTGMTFTYDRKDRCRSSVCRSFQLGGNQRS